MIYNLIFIVLVLFFMVMIIKSTLETQLFFNRLEKEYPQLWEELGRPRWRIHFGDSNFREAVKMIRTHKFASLEDKELERIYKAIKGADKAAVLSAVAAIAVTMYQAFLLS